MSGEKKGKLFVKDTSGNVVQVIPESVAVIPDYQGATDSAAGVAGLVPAALSNQREKVLRGDGTWVDAGVPTGTCNCNYVYVKKTFYAGVNISDGDGDWLSNAATLTANLSPTESRRYSLNLRFGADGPGGCALYYPYNATQPASLEDRTYEFYRDPGVLARNNNTNHYAQTFSDGFTMDAWIEVDQTQSGYHNLYIMVYGPKAQDIPRLVPLNVDGTDMFLTQNLTAGESADIAVSGTTIKLYPRPTYRTEIYRNEGTVHEPIEITSTPYKSPYLSYTAVRTATGIRITADDYNLNDWPTELSSVSLSLTSGSTTNVIDMNCLPYWMSLQLTKVDESIAAVNARVSSIGVYQGATSSEGGHIGLVPAATAAERNMFLRGDGTWADVEIMSDTDLNDVWDSVFLDLSPSSEFAEGQMTVPSNGYVKLSIARNKGGSTGYATNEWIISRTGITIQSGTDSTLLDVFTSGVQTYDLDSSYGDGICIEVYAKDGNDNWVYYSTMGNMLTAFANSPYSSWEEGIRDAIYNRGQGVSLVLPDGEQYVYNCSFWNYINFNKTPLTQDSGSVSYFLKYKSTGPSDKNGTLVSNGLEATLVNDSGTVNLILNWNGVV